MGAAVFLMLWLKHDYVRVATYQEVQHLVVLINEERPNLAEGRRLWRPLSSGWNLVTVPVNFIEDLPPELETFVELANEQGEVLFSQHGNWQMFGPLQRNNFLYVAVSEPPWYKLFDMQERVTLVVTIILIVTLLCLSLVWSLTLPIRQLQRAVRHLAQGDFDITGLKPVQKRNDELGQLATDIIEMVTSLERLLDSHQQLLRDVSHELRSPLTRLQIALGIARKKDQEKLHEYEHGRIERAVEQVNHLISEILDLARLQTTGQLKKQKLLLKQQLQMWIEDAELELQPKQLKVEWQLPNYVVPVRCDWLLIERAFDNLLRNAIRFSPEGSTLTIGVEHFPDGKQTQVALWVQDEGPGVPESQVNDIFNAFTQVDFARDHASGGYGLGLALVKRIAEIHGGKVQASNHNPGLRISILLPQE